MKTYSINYDLNNQKDYESLISAIKKVGDWCHPLKSSWAVKSNWTAVQIRDYLLQFMDADDCIIVAELTGDAAWSLKKTCSDWFKAELTNPLTRIFAT